MYGTFWLHGWLVSEEIEFHGWLGKKKKCLLPPPQVFFSGIALIWSSEISKALKNLSPVQIRAVYIGDNCIKNFLMGKYIIWNLVLWRWTSSNHSYVERFKLHKAIRHPTKSDIINDVKLFPTVYCRIYSYKFLKLFNQTLCYKSKCIRIQIYLFFKVHTEYILICILKIIIPYHMKLLFFSG